MELFPPKPKQSANLLQTDLVCGLGELVGGGEVPVKQLPDHLLVARPRSPVQRRPPVRVPFIIMYILTLKDLIKLDYINLLILNHL